ncbi:hypothetical protein [Flagellimonas meridianipacifica]|uniref:3-keto-disaccharide hydrolase domain-containing protein n=1 Tax=Flagellimonas meridianipacifica TaxID=1080225 RepID=A0A2T0MBF6_9FLAO|nr:hypothetical protein [Allomuricauda pacifica]PRX54834.1 hypothetical protein CLV81_3238 [Allomuricauda pacifica]
MRTVFLYAIAFFLSSMAISQESIPLDTLHWDINARAHVFEPFKGKDAIYLLGGSMSLKNAEFLNGTIEYDIYMTGDRGFPGVYFRVNGTNAEQFYIRPHQSGNPDANQAVALFNGITPWQFYFGPKYSFPYKYPVDRWMHIKIVVQDDNAQIYLDNSEKPNLSWKLFHNAKSGGLSFTGGLNTGVHLSNFTVKTEEHEIVNFNPGKREPIEGAIQQWQISDKFEEKLLDDPKSLQKVIDDRKWDETILLEEGVAANISRKVELRSQVPGNTVFAKINISSRNEVTRLFEFGYSDRVVVILNGKPIYTGNNGFRSRDYRYLGTIGLFDAVYLNLKKGNNALLLAVSENFGGWLVTGRFPNSAGLRIQ